MDDTRPTSVRALLALLWLEAAVAAVVTAGFLALAFSFHLQARRGPDSWADFFEILGLLGASAAALVLAAAAGMARMARRRSPATPAVVATLHGLAALLAVSSIRSLGLTAAATTLLVVAAVAVPVLAAALAPGSRAWFRTSDRSELSLPR